MSPPGQTSAAPVQRIRISALASRKINGRSAKSHFLAGPGGLNFEVDMGLSLLVGRGRSDVSAEDRRV